MDTHEAYNRLFEESLKLQKVNRSVFKKLNKFESEMGDL